jgi:zinc protease
MVSVKWCLLTARTFLLVSSLLVAATTDARTDSSAGATRPTDMASDVTPDPAVLFGVLKNGMRYQIQHNSTPAGEVSLRLRVAAGSIHERDDEQGIAHLLEHMAFRGSTHLADGEAFKTLERLGLQRGPDANANTMVTETVYQIDLPHNDAASVDAGLMLMREFASELALDAKALDAERSVVLSEARVRAVPAARMGQEGIAFWLQGQRAAQRLPNGKTEVIEHATPQMLKRFYRAYYRPERTVLVAVGNGPRAE